MVKVFLFEKNGYEPFLDFLKAYAILCVLIGHTFPFHDKWGYGIWAGMQVPIFILIQTFHFLKKDSALNFKKMMWRVFFPYFIVQFVLFTLFFFLKENCDFILTLKHFGGGGSGPGSYYPWVYLQIALILPFAKAIMDGKSKVRYAFYFLFICECCEILFSIIDFPDSLYRLLAIRYIFLIFLGWIWTIEGIVLNKMTLLFSFVSFLAIIYFEYFSVNDEPFFYKTAWKYQRWPCYYYVAMGGTFLLHALYEKLKQYKILLIIIKLLAQCSYEIFLIQMLVFSIFWNFNLMPDSLILKAFEAFILSILGGSLFHVIYNKFLDLCANNLAIR